MVRHSNSLILIWRLAEFEARLANSLTIEPTHLLLGLCKSVDIDLPGLFAKRSPDREEMLKELFCEVGRLQCIFQTACIDARTFRRALRRLCAQGRIALSESKHLRRSKMAKEVFADAEHLAEIAHCDVFPVHLLYAVLLAKDEARDNVMRQLGVKSVRLRKVAKLEAMLSGGRDNSRVECN